MEQNQRAERIDQLAKEVLTLSRNTLLVNLRFLDMALSQFEYRKDPGGSLATEGRHIFYDPVFVLQSYKEDKNAPVRAYLHMVLHCIFRHMNVSPTLERRYWNLACDLAVENMINEQHLPVTETQRQSRQAHYLQTVHQHVKLMTAEKIYSYLKENLSEDQLQPMEEVFLQDEHEVWYGTDKKDPDSFEGSGDDGTESDQAGKPDQNEKGQGEEGVSAKELDEIWNSIAQRMQTDLETFSRQQGSESGSLVQNLKAVNREKYDYSAFLKKFAVMGETMKINDDEFDYVFYTYGLKLYENMPLVEPLEYKEVKKIREFVIAIDTSGSTSGELVQRFLQKTYNILKSTESFFSKVNVHIIQCDAEIQDDTRITCQQDFDRYIRNMKILGLGGTDFRPVFSYVEQLRRQKEFTNLKGLIYFTDGFGTFPDKKPDYNTAFIYIDDDYNNPEVPSWAIRLVLQSDEIKQE